MSVISMFLLSCVLHTTTAPVQAAQPQSVLKSQVNYERADVAKFKAVYTNESQPRRSDCVISIAGSTSKEEGESEASWKWRLRISTPEAPETRTRSQYRSDRQPRTATRTSYREPVGRSLNLDMSEAESVIQMLSEDFDPESAFGLSGVSSGAVLGWRSGRGNADVWIVFTLGTNAEWVRETSLFGSAIDEDSEGNLAKALSKALAEKPSASTS